MLGWVAPAYHKEKGATPHPGACNPNPGACNLHPGACKFSLKYDGRPDECLGEQVGMWNLGSLSGKGGEVHEELRKRRIDVCCLQGVR